MRAYEINYGELPEINAKDIQILDIIGYYDGPLSGICEYNNKKLYYEIYCNDIFVYILFDVPVDDRSKLYQLDHSLEVDQAVGWFNGNDVKWGLLERQAIHD